MAFYSGTTGYVMIGATAYRFDKWRLSIKSGSPKVTNFTGSGFQQIVPGVVSGTLTVSGPYDQGAMPFAVNTAYAFKVGLSTGVELTVTAMVTSIDPENDVNDAPRVSITAESTGVFTASIT